MEDIVLLEDLILILIHRLQGQMAVMELLLMVVMNIHNIITQWYTHIILLDKLALIHLSDLL